MKTFVRALALLTALLLVVGCEALTRSWLPIATDRSLTTATITGRVVDAANNVLPNALVSNGASVALTEADGTFALSDVTLGIQYVTASFDGVKSNPVEIEVKEGDNHINKLIIDVFRPVSDQSAVIKFIQVFPDTLTASYSVNVATDDIAVPPTYSATRYNNGRDVLLTVAAPPGGSGVTLKSYRITYKDDYADPYRANFTSPMIVGPGSMTSSGPNKNLPIKNVGPTAIQFSNNLATGSLEVVEAKITLYDVDESQQAKSEPVAMHAPIQGDKDATASFEVNVYIQKSDY